MNPRAARAEQVATAAIQAYCAELKPTGTDDLACLLTKLISTTAAAVIKYCGPDVALGILDVTRTAIAEREPDQAEQQALRKSPQIYTAEDMQAAVLAERERCARLCQELMLTGTIGAGGTRDIALAEAVELIRGGRRPMIPAEVVDALDRMCRPLHSSVLSGPTAEADARSMEIIRAFVMTTGAAPEPDNPTPPSRRRRDERPGRTSGVREWGDGH